MTSIWLFLSDLFKWSFGFYPLMGTIINWVLFLVASAFFIYWCYILVVTLGGDKDHEYKNETAGKFPYYDPEIYRKD